MRLDRFLTRNGGISSKHAAQALADRKVLIDGITESDGKRSISRFHEVSLSQHILQSKEAIYLMLHKPAGYLSATSDPQHPTVLELVNHPLKAELHLAGRLDRASTGLVLLTNDGRWSKRITEPLEKIPKTYRITTRDPIPPHTTDIFAKGIYFSYEDITTMPAELSLISSNEALMTIHEGRYHQIKRMFHAVGNQVISLHREQIGPLALDPMLPSGQCRPLTPSEISFFHPL
jgi:16S rRNA pseudouridine516 synthase